MTFSRPQSIQDVVGTQYETMETAVREIQETLFVSTESARTITVALQEDVSQVRRLLCTFIVRPWRNVYSRPIRGSLQTVCVCVCVCVSVYVCLCLCLCLCDFWSMSHKCQLTDGLFVALF